MRWLVTAVGIGLLAFGLGCLNYTRADGLEHHTEFAHDHGLPPPSESILYGGVLAVIVGSGLVGYAFGSRGQRARITPAHLAPDRANSST